MQFILLYNIKNDIIIFLDNYTAVLFQSKSKIYTGSSIHTLFALLLLSF